MGKKKAKSGAYLKSVNIILADYLQSVLGVQIRISDNIEEVQHLGAMAGKAKGMLKRDDTIEILSDNTVEQNYNSVIQYLAKVENEAVIKSATLTMAKNYKPKKKRTQKQRVLQLFSDKGELTIASINKFCNFEINHPNAVIRDLRKAGVNVLDRLEAGATGHKHKVYWIEE